MKSFACGDVVPGCDTTFVGHDDDEIFASVGQHAAEAHGLGAVQPEMVAQVRSLIVET